MAASSIQVGSGLRRRRLSRPISRRFTMADGQHVEAGRHDPVADERAHVVLHQADAAQIRRPSSRLPSHPEAPRKTTENTIVMSAPIGLSQNESCSKRTWRSTSGRSRGTAEGATDRRLDRHCSRPVPGQAEVDVLERDASDREPAQRVPALERPSGELVQYGDIVLRLDLHHRAVPVTLDADRRNRAVAPGDTPRADAKRIVTAPRSRPPIEEGVPMATIACPNRTATRSASASTSSM